MYKHFSLTGQVDVPQGVRRQSLYSGIQGVEVAQPNMCRIELLQNGNNHSHTVLLYDIQRVIADLRLKKLKGGANATSSTERPAPAIP